MSAPLETETQIQIALRTLTAAETRQRENLAACVRAARITAAQLTNEELRRWTAVCAKMWRAQNELARRNGAGRSNVDPPNPQKTIRAQARRSWLGTVAGIALPVALFGTHLIDHGFILPLFWMCAVGADVIGRNTCLRFAQTAEPRRTPQPEVVMRKVGLALDHARTSARWGRAMQTAHTLVAVDAAIYAHDAALKHGRRFGKRVTAGPAAIFAYDVAAARIHTLPSVTAPWAICAITLVAVFGLACWLTSFAYTAVLDQPPYPMNSSAERVVHHVQVETRLFKGAAVASSNDIEVLTTNAMRNKRALSMALRELRRSERFLDDTQCRVAELEALPSGHRASLIGFAPAESIPMG